MYIPNTICHKRKEVSLFYGKGEELARAREREKELTLAGYYIASKKRRKKWSSM